MALNASLPLLPLLSSLSSVIPAWDPFASFAPTPVLPPVCVLAPLYSAFKYSHGHTSNLETVVINGRENLRSRHSVIVGTSCPQGTPKVGRNHFEFTSLCLKAQTWNFHEVVDQNILKFHFERNSCYGYKMHCGWEQERSRFRRNTLKTRMCFSLYSPCLFNRVRLCRS